jgi:hypothetical protein
LNLDTRGFTSIQIIQGHRNKDTTKTLRQKRGLGRTQENKRSHTGRVEMASLVTPVSRIQTREGGEPAKTSETKRTMMQEISSKMINNSLSKFTKRSSTTTQSSSRPTEKAGKVLIMRRAADSKLKIRPPLGATRVCSLRILLLQ